jgi:hypothetical protein
LFASVKEFRDISLTYSRVQYILPFLENAENVEDRLEAFRAEGEKEIERRRQLTAVQVSRASERACFATFNYDTLLEHALRGMDISIVGMDGYISHHKHSLVKLHGSIDWVHWVPRSAMNGAQNEALRDLSHSSHSNALANGLIHAARTLMRTASWTTVPASGAKSGGASPGRFRRWPSPQSRSTLSSVRQSILTI